MFQSFSRIGPSCMLVLLGLNYAYSALTINAIDTAANNVTQGSTGISVSMVVNNTGDYDVMIDSASLSFKDGTTDVASNFTVTRDPQGSNFIPRKSTNYKVNFIVDVKPTATSGTITIDGSLSGRENLIPNGGFEENDTAPANNWYHEDPNNQYRQYILDNSAAYEGKQSYKLTLISAPKYPALDSWIRIHSGTGTVLIPVTPNTAYTLQVTYKDEAFGSVNRYLVYEEFDSNRAIFGGQHYTFLSHTDLWTTVGWNYALSSVVTTSSTTYLKMWFGLLANQNNYNGTIWVDNVKFYNPLAPSLSDSNADTTDSWTVGTDAIAPAAVNNLAARQGTNAGEITLNWTAPGDDDNVGTAKQYDIRYRTDGNVTDSNWTTSTEVSNEPVPVVAGTAQTLTIANLTVGATYYLALKTSDKVNNVSVISNSVSTYATPPKPDSSDPTAPGTPNDEGDTTTSTIQLRFTWTVATDPESGIATYLLCIGDTPGATNILNDKDVGNVLNHTATGLSLSPGKTYYAKVKAKNGAGMFSLYSGNSNGILVTTDGGTKDPEVKLYQPYPSKFNPAKGESVTIKYNVPETALVTIKVYNLNGELVTKLVDGEKNPGLYYLPWYGMNDNNEKIASGVYIVHLKVDTNTQIQKVLVVK